MTIIAFGAVLRLSFNVLINIKADDLSERDDKMFLFLKNLLQLFFGAYISAAIVFRVVFIIVRLFDIIDICVLRV